VNEFFSSLELIVPTMPKLEEQSILERLIEPERIITFRVPWQNDQGKIIVNRGYRIQFNSAIGPYKGGLRFDESGTSRFSNF
jgi:glutamate dehydrogenase (NADP+)